MSVVKVVELIGTSPESWNHAVQNVVAEASKTLRHIRGIDMVKQTAHVEHGKITEYRATVNVAFLLEEHRELV
jgi:dodecin